MSALNKKPVSHEKLWVEASDLFQKLFNKHLDTPMHDKNFRRLNGAQYRAFNRSQRRWRKFVEECGL